VNKNIPEFFIKKNNTDAIFIIPLPMEEIKAKFKQLSDEHTFR
jgi:hypothetical protein